MAALQAYLIDTNVIFETVRSQPAPQVMHWLAGLQPEQIFVSVLSLGEIRKGALAVADKRRRTKLLDWLHTTLPAWFDNRVLPVDAAVCERWAELMVNAATPVPAIDSLLAATASHAGLVMATRNARDFARLDVKVFNPWEI